MDNHMEGGRSIYQCVHLSDGLALRHKLHLSCRYSGLCDSVERAGKGTSIDEPANTTSNPTGHALPGIFFKELPMAKKTKINIITVFDGNQDATEVFAALIAEKMQTVMRNPLAGRDAVCYDKNKVQVTGGLASGLCG